MIMTGTFATHSPLDVWGQTMVLGAGLLGTTNFFSFKTQYCIEEEQYFGQRHFKKIVGYRDLDGLNRKIKTFASIKTRDECFDLPPKIYKKIEVPLTDEQQETYASIRDMAIAEFGDGLIIEVSSAMEIISKLDQVAVGQIKIPDTNDYRILKNNRVETLLARLEDTNDKGIIWCNYRGMLEHVYEEIRKNFDLNKVARYYGGVPDHERETAVKDFQDPESPLRWIVANQQSLGYGRTLTLGRENFYISNSYNLEHRLQSEDRTMRLGQTQSVLYNDFFTGGTVNERIYQNLRAKKNMMAEVLGTPIGKWI
jgi:SNF2 family DNA or RNA helicase